jgi:hypothetical protein
VPERDIRKELKERVQSHFGEVRALVWFGRRNAPDVFCLLPAGMPSYCDGEWVYDGVPQHPLVETKAPDGKPTEAQAREHKRLRAAGCDVRVISTFEQLDNWLPRRA